MDGRHILQGNCPDDLDPEARDPDCPVCQALIKFEQKSKPHWWPQNPYPKDIFVGGIEDYIAAIPDNTLRTAISGILGNIFWTMASDSILFNLKSYVAMLAEDCDSVQFKLEIMEDLR